VNRGMGNVRLKAARQHVGLPSQQALADALTRAAPQLGMGHLMISARQVRRWESAEPPWPRGDHQKLLVHVLHLPIEELGFTAPWTDSKRGLETEQAVSRRSLPKVADSTPMASGMVQPQSAVGDYATVTAAYRRLYATVPPQHLHDAVMEHARVGRRLMPETLGVSRQILAAALAEALLLAGRMQFFDLRRPEDAEGTYVQALQAAAEAQDSLLGAAILAHAAFIPAWVKDLEQAGDRLRAARVYARRAAASADVIAWIDAVEAECESISGNVRPALKVIDRAEATLATPNEHESPAWFTWFSPVRLAAFKGNIQLKAGLLSQARKTLKSAVEEASPADDKQLTVILSDLAAVEAASGHTEEACKYAEQALDQLARTWYGTGMERVLEVRRSLQAEATLECVQHLDDRLYDWQTTLSALRH